MLQIVLCHVYIYAFNMLAIAKEFAVYHLSPAKCPQLFEYCTCIKLATHELAICFLLLVCTDSVQGALLCVHAWTLSCHPWPYKTLYRRQLFPAPHLSQIEKKATSEVSDIPMEDAGGPPKRLFLSPNVWMALQPSGAEKLLSLVLWVCMQYIGELRTNQCVSVYEMQLIPSIPLSCTYGWSCSSRLLHWLKATLHLVI